MDPHIQVLPAMEEKRDTKLASQATILVVDDDPALRLALGIRLRANHYKTVGVGDGYSALALAQRERPDLILLDLGLPGFATGADVLKHMRAFPALAPIPVIVVTGWDSRDYAQPLAELGAVAYVQKPFDEEELLDHIRYCLGSDKKKSVGFRS
jgi:two-component system KDP operon response regulator KdpE